MVVSHAGEQPASRRPIRLALSLVGLAVGLDVASRLVRSYRKFDPTGGHPLELPPGEETTVTTDDAAVLNVWSSKCVEGAESESSLPTVVFVHGLATDLTMWAPVARRLGELGFKTIAYDQRGHGQSTLGAEAISADRLARDLRCVVEALELSDVVVVGHSAGGIVAESLLVHATDEFASRLLACVLCSTGSTTRKLDAVSEAIIAAFTGSSIIERIVSIRAVGRVLFTGFAGPIQPAAHVAAALHGYTQSPGHVRVAMLKVTQSDYMNLLATVRTPVTVVIGDDDRYVPPARARELASEIPGASFSEIQGVAHMVPFEAPDELAAVIDSVYRDARQEILGGRSRR